jgi:hypothetical protein
LPVCYVHLVLEDEEIGLKRGSFVWRKDIDVLAKGLKIGLGGSMSSTVTTYLVDLVAEIIDFVP